MLVVTFDPRQDNCVVLPERAFFLVQTPTQGPVLHDLRCPHRGGPLHLGSWEEGSGALVCPWHGTKMPLMQVVTHGVPLIARTDRVVAIVDAPADTPVHFCRKLILVEEAWSPEALAPLVGLESDHDRQRVTGSGRADP